MLATLPDDIDTTTGVRCPSASTHPYAVIEFDHAGWQRERSRHTTKEGAHRAAAAHHKPLVRAYMWRGMREGWVLAGDGF